MILHCLLVVVNVNVAVCWFVIVVADVPMVGELRVEPGAPGMDVVDSTHQSRAFGVGTLW